MPEVWNSRIVEESNLNRAVSTLRGILGDSPSRADLIETIPRVGYRFVPPVEQRPIGGTSVRVAPVGREAELTTLELLLDQAKGGRETVALVSGEAGMGKTALVTEFLSRLPEKAVPAGRAACTERLAGPHGEGGTHATLLVDQLEPPAAHDAGHTRGLRGARSAEGQAQEPQVHEGEHGGQQLRLHRVGARDCCGA